MNVGDFVLGHSKLKGICKIPTVVDHHLIRWEADASMHCTFLAKIFQKSTRSTQRARAFFFSQFLQFATFISKAAFFISKNVIFYMFDF